MDIKKIVDSLSIEELCQQVLVRSLSNKYDPSDVKERIKKNPVGSFYCDQVEEKIGMEKLNQKSPRSFVSFHITVSPFLLPATQDLQRD